MTESFLQRILRWLTLRRVFLLLFGGAGALVIGLLAHEVIVATESSSFCGQVCHTPMYPEYTVYQASPHSTVPCSSCHVGEGVTNLVASKLRGLPQIPQTITGMYERPIPSPVENLRPARETCERCHTPGKFSGEYVKTNTRYQPDESNSKETDTIVLKVGGGESDVADGIHWHIASEVWYLPLDEERLEVGWVGVKKAGGALEEYVNPAAVANLTPELIQDQKRRMDCIDCHNRATHIFRSPAELVDKALTEGSMDASLPFLKREAVKALDPPNASLEEAYTKVEAVKDFYQASYPEVYASKKGEIDRSVEELRDIARLTTFPEMKVDWTTHADQSGHNKPPEEALAGWEVNFDHWQNNKSPGCFRCHGTLVPVSDGSSAINQVAPGAVLAAGVAPPKEPLDASCNLCHYSPSPQLSPIPKPVSHPVDGLQNCLLCHDKAGPEPIPADHPWTANAACTACHRVAPGSSSPAPPATTLSSFTRDIPHTTSGLKDCLLCHDQSAVKPVKADHPWSSNDTCTACHQTAPVTLPLPRAASTPARAPDILHPVAGLQDCLQCHGGNGPKPVSSSHPWSTNEACTACHKTAPTSASLPSPVNNPSLLPAPTTTLARPVPHTVDGGLANCRQCHGAALPLPANHSSIGNELCTLCHRPAPVVIPPTNPVPAVPVPHSTQGLGDCLSCHNTTGALPFPSDHAGRTNAMCIICHKPPALQQAPAVSSGNASGITASSATLGGTLDSLGSAATVSVSFQWGITPGGPYPNETASATRTATGAFQSNLTSLSAGTTYYFRAKASGSSVIYGAERSFTTTQPASSPAVTTSQSLNITANSAALRGSLDSLGGAPSVNVSFQWGTSPSGPYPNETIPANMGTTGIYQSTIGGLTPGTTYYFRAKASGSSTTYGLEKSFTTPTG